MSHTPPQHVGTPGPGGGAAEGPGALRRRGCVGSWTGEHWAFDWPPVPAAPGCSWWLMRIVWAGPADNARPILHAVERRNNAADVEVTPHA